MGGDVPAGGAASTGGSSSEAPRDPASAASGSGVVDSGGAAAPEPLASDDSPSDCLPPEDDPISTRLGYANNIVISVCVSCHGGSAIEAGSGAAPRFEGLGDTVARDLLDPCAPDESPIIRVFRESHVPPVEPVLSELDLAALEEALPSLCEPPMFTDVFCREAPFYPGCGVVDFESTVRGSCGHCHGEQAGGLVPLGGASVLDAPSLLAAGAVVPCDLEASPLVRVMQNGAVPPHETCVRFPSSPELRPVERFVTGLCEVDAERGVEREAAEVLGVRCGACHGEDAPALPADLAFTVDDLGSLVRAGVVLPCVPERSPLLSALQGGHALAAGVGGPPSEAEVDTVVRFIESFCAGPSSRARGETE